MEKIQEALAKARTARQGREQSAPAVITSPVTVSAEQPVSPDQATTQAWAKLTPYSAIPARLERAHIATLSGGPDASPFDVMRTKLIQTMRTNNWRRLAITSPAAACGKSTVTLNLAFSLARQTDVRTIVAELDLRRPSLAKTLGVTPARNFADVLIGKAEFADQALLYGDNLAFALNAAQIKNPAELLHGNGVAERLTAIETAYAPDLTIFDMPPMMINDDMMAFAGKVDCVLLIAAAEKTTIKEIDACERELSSQTNVMGVVLNKCRYMGEDYGYGY